MASGGTSYHCREKPRLIPNMLPTYYLHSRVVIVTHFSIIIDAGVHSKINL